MSFTLRGEINDDALQNGVSPVKRPGLGRQTAAATPLPPSPHGPFCRSRAVFSREPLGVPARPASGPFAGFSPGFPAEFLVAKKSLLFLVAKKFGVDGFLPDAGNPCGNPFRV